MSNEFIYEVFTTKTCEKLIRKLPVNIKKAFYAKLNFISKDPSHKSLNTKEIVVSKQKLNQLGIDKVYEFRINMSFRCLFYFIESDKQIVAFLVGNHEDVARWTKS